MLRVSGDVLVDRFVRIPTVREAQRGCGGHGRTGVWYLNGKHGGTEVLVIYFSYYGIVQNVSFFWYYGSKQEIENVRGAWRIVW